jgi:pyridoxine 5-phosphate synthase
VVGQRSRVAEVVALCRDAGLAVSLFIDPSPEQVAASAAAGAHAVELHTGRYADATRPAEARRELEALVVAGKASRDAGLTLHAGHGLNYRNVAAVARIEGMVELNIGHSIVSRALFSGLREAVRAMRRAIGSADDHPFG